MSTSYKPEDFVSALKEGRFQQTSCRFTLECLARAGEDSQSLAFCFTKDGGEWLNLPISLIEQVEYLGSVSVGHLQFPQVRVQFKSPPPENTLARVYAAIAQSLMTPNGL
jgi:hypothetical protein